MYRLFLCLKFIFFCYFTTLKVLGKNVHHYFQERFHVGEGKFTKRVIIFGTEP